MNYLYFNKKTFRALIKLWRAVCWETMPYATTQKDDWLMENFMPIKFIEDIERTLGL